MREKYLQKTHLESHTATIKWLPILLLVVLLSVSLVSGLSVIEKYIDAPDSSGNVYGADRMSAQNFTLGVTGVDTNYLLRKIEFLTIKTGTPSLLQISIVLLNGSGIPNITTTGNFLTYGNVLSGDVGAGLQDVNVSVATILTASTRYGIVWNSTASGVADYWSIRGKNANAYEGGNWLEFISPTWTSYAAKDFMFALWGDSEYVYPNLLAPADSASYVPNININFSANYTAGKYNITNSSFYIWDNTNIQINKTSVDVEINNETSTLIKISSLGNYHWGVEVCGINESESSLYSCEFSGTNRTIDITSWIENSQSFNTTTYETSSELFNLNISYETSIYSSLSAKLNYNGTTYTGTKTGAGSEAIFTKSISVNSSIGTKNVFWEIYFVNTTGTFNSNSTKSTQAVSPIYLSLCNTTSATRFINFTVKDETTDNIIMGNITSGTFLYWLGDGTTNKTYSFTNLTGSTEYNLCFEPNKSVNVQSTIQYAATGYPQRIFEDTNILTNFTTNKTLYLLSSASGLYVTFQITNVAEQPLEGVFVTAVRDGNPIGSGTSGADGGITFWVNPDFLHVFTFTKTGYDTYTTSIYPTQTSYTITLGTAAVSEVNDYTKGISYTINPIVYYLNNITDYTFEFNLTSSYWDVSSFGFNITNNSGFSLGNVVVATNGGSATLAVNTGNNTELSMNYYWIVSGNVSWAAKHYVILDTSRTDWSLRYLFQDFRTFLTSNMFGLTNFGLSIILFIFIFVFTGIMSLKFGFTSPAALMTLVFTLVLFLDVGVGLIPNPVGAITYFPTIFVGFIFIGVFLREALR